MAPRVPKVKPQQVEAAAAAAAKVARRGAQAVSGNPLGRSFTSGAMSQAGSHRFGSPVWDYMRSPIPQGMNPIAYRAGQLYQDVPSLGTAARTLFQAHPADFVSTKAHDLATRHTAAPNAWNQNVGWGAVLGMGVGAYNMDPFNLAQGMRPQGYQALSLPDRQADPNNPGGEIDYRQSTNPMMDNLQRLALGRSGRLLPFDQFITERADKAAEVGLDPKELQGLQILNQSEYSGFEGGLLPEREFYQANRDYVKQAGREKAAETYGKIRQAYEPYAEYQEYLGKPLSTGDYSMLKLDGGKVDPLAYQQYRDNTYKGGPLAQATGGLARYTEDGIEGGPEARVMGYRVNLPGVAGAALVGAGGIGLGRAIWGAGSGQGAQMDRFTPPNSPTTPPNAQTSSKPASSGGLRQAEAVYQRAIAAANRVAPERLSVQGIERGLSRNTATAGLDDLARQQMAQQIYQQSMRSRGGTQPQQVQQQQGGGMRSPLNARELQAQQMAQQQAMQGMYGGQAPQQYGMEGGRNAGLNASFNRLVEDARRYPDQLDVETILRGVSQTPEFASLDPLAQRAIADQAFAQVQKPMQAILSSEERARLRSQKNLEIQTGRARYFEDFQDRGYATEAAEMADSGLDRQGFELPNKYRAGLSDLPPRAKDQYLDLVKNEQLWTGQISPDEYRSIRARLNYVPTMPRAQEMTSYQRQQSRQRKANENFWGWDRFYNDNYDRLQEGAQEIADRQADQKYNYERYSEPSDRLMRQSLDRLPEQMKQSYLRQAQTMMPERVEAVQSQLWPQRSPLSARDRQAAQMAAQQAAQAAMGGEIPQQMAQEVRNLRPGDRPMQRSVIDGADLQGWSGGEGRARYGRAQGLDALSLARDPRYGLIADFDPQTGYQGFLAYRDGGQMSVTSLGARDPGTGAGSRLMQEMFAEAARRGKGVQVAAGADAAAFYERMGMKANGPGSYALSPEEVQQRVAPLSARDRQAAQMAAQQAAQAAMGGEIPQQMAQEMPARARIPAQSPGLRRAAIANTGIDPLAASVERMGEVGGYPSVDEFSAAKRLPPQAGTELNRYARTRATDLGYALKPTEQGVDAFGYANIEARPVSVPRRGPFGLFGEDLKRARYRFDHNVAINQADPPWIQGKTALHELGHHELGHLGAQPNDTIDRSTVPMFQKELEAEAVAQRAAERINPLRAKATRQPSVNYLLEQVGNSPMGWSPEDAAHYISTPEVRSEIERAAKTIAPRQNIPIFRPATSSPLSARDRQAAQMAAQRAAQAAMGGEIPQQMAQEGRRLSPQRRAAMEAAQGLGGGWDFSVARDIGTQSVTVYGMDGQPFREVGSLTRAAEMMGPAAQRLKQLEIQAQMAQQVGDIDGFNRLAAEMDKTQATLEGQNLKYYPSASAQERMGITGPRQLQQRSPMLQSPELMAEQLRAAGRQIQGGPGGPRPTFDQLQAATGMDRGQILQAGDRLKQQGRAWSARPQGAPPALPPSLGGSKPGDWSPAEPVPQRLQGVSLDVTRDPLRYQQQAAMQEWHWGERGARGDRQMTARGMDTPRPRGNAAARASLQMELQGPRTSPMSLNDAMGQVMQANQRFEATAQQARAIAQEGAPAAYQRAYGGQAPNTNQARLEELRGMVRDRANSTAARGMDPDFDAIRRVNRQQQMQGIMTGAEQDRLALAQEKAIARGRQRVAQRASAPLSNVQPPTPPQTQQLPSRPPMRPTDIPADQRGVRSLGRYQIGGKEFEQVAVEGRGMSIGVTQANGATLSSAQAQQLAADRYVQMYGGSRDTARRLAGDAIAQNYGKPSMMPGGPMVAQQPVFSGQPQTGRSIQRSPGGNFAPRFSAENPAIRPEVLGGSPVPGRSPAGSIGGPTIDVMGRPVESPALGRGVTRGLPAGAPQRLQGQQMPSYRFPEPARAVQPEVLGGSPVPGRSPAGSIGGPTIDVMGRPVESPALGRGMARSLPSGTQRLGGGMTGARLPQASPAIQPEVMGGAATRGTPIRANLGGPTVDVMGSTIGVPATAQQRAARAAAIPPAAQRAAAPAARPPVGGGAVPPASSAPRLAPGQPQRGAVIPYESVPRGMSTAQRLEGGMVTTGSPRAMGTMKPIANVPNPGKAAKALGIAGTAITIAGAGMEYARARGEGEGQGRSLARGAATLATDTVAWVAEPLAKGAAGIQGSLFNPLNVIDLARSAAGDRGADQRIQQRTAAASSGRAAVERGIAQLPRAAVDLFTGQGATAQAPLPREQWPAGATNEAEARNWRKQQQQSRPGIMETFKGWVTGKKTSAPPIAQVKPQAVAPSVNYQRSAAAITPTMAQGAQQQGPSAQMSQGFIERMVNADGTLTDYGRNMQGELGDIGFNKILQDAYKAQGKTSSSGGSPADAIGQEKERSRGAVQVAQVQGGTQKQIAQIESGVGYDRNRREENVGLDRNLKDYQQAIGVANINAGTAYDRNRREENVGLDSNLKGLQGRMYESDNSLRGTYDTNLKNLQGRMYETDGNVKIAGINAGVGYDRNRREENVGLDSNLKGLQGKMYEADSNVKIADIKGGYDLAGTQYRTQGDIAIADIKGGYDLAGVKTQTQGNIKIAEIGANRDLAVQGLQNQGKIAEIRATADANIKEEQGKRRYMHGDAVRDQVARVTAAKKERADSRAAFQQQAKDVFMSDLARADAQRQRDSDLARSREATLGSLALERERRRTVVAEASINRQSSGTDIQNLIRGALSASSYRW